MHGPSLPFRGRWLGAAETERSYQICSNLSVSLRLPAPLEGGAFGMHPVGAGLCSYRMHPKRLPFQGSWQPKAD